jgi:hypothetical protein
MRKCIFYLIITLFLISCSSVNDSIHQEQYISVTLTYEDSVETLKIVDNTFLQGQGATYSVNSDITIINLIDLTADKPIGLNISFKGQATGEYDWTILHSSYLMTINKNNLVYSLITISGQTNLTKYGAVDGRVEGNFDGIVFDTSSRDTLNVIGEFSVRRQKDFNPDL